MNSGLQDDHLLSLRAGPASEQSNAVPKRRSRQRWLSQILAIPELTVIELSRDHSIRFSDGPAFVTGVFQAFVCDLCPKRFQRWCCCHECVPFSIVRVQGIVQSPIDPGCVRTRALGAPIADAAMPAMI
jgi:hypothetical protein